MSAATTKRASIHPRFRARRIAVKRDAGRRRLRRLVTLAVFATVLVLAYLVTRSPLLDLDRVEITGTTNTDVTEVTRVGRLSTGQPMTDIDIERAQRAIEELPWVDTVSIDRRWPGTLRITIVERQPVASLLVANSSWLVVDATGRVLRTATTKPDGLPVVSSLGVAATPGETVASALPGVTLASYLTPDLRAWLGEIVIRDDGLLEATLHNSITAYFGSQAHLYDKVIGLATVLTRVDLKDVKSIDLAVPNSPVLTRRSTPG